MKISFVITSYVIETGQFIYSLQCLRRIAVFNILANVLAFKVNKAGKE